MEMLALSSLLHRSLFHNEHSQPLATKLTPSLTHSPATDHSTCLCPVCLQIKTAAFLFLPDKSHQLELHTSMKQGAGVILKDQPVQIVHLYLKTSSSTPGEHSYPRTLRGMDGWKSTGGQEEGISLCQRRQVSTKSLS